jgi:Spy/CpxP family protein refolding chaperone
LLALSLSFNVVFVLGFLRGRATRHRLANPEGRKQFIVERLHLDTSQEAAFEGALQDATRRGDGLRRAGRKTARSFWQELAEPEPDAERLHALLEESIELRRSAQVLAVDHMLTVLRILTPKQRTAYLKMARRARDLPR